MELRSSFLAKVSEPQFRALQRNPYRLLPDPSPEVTVATPQEHSL